MKRKTFVRYFGVISVSLVIMSVTALFSALEYYFEVDSFVVHKTVPVKNDITIVIDAGHGGEDGGAVGDTLGTLEKNINLAISKELYSLLLLTDIDVVMTRTEDKMLYKEGQESNKKSNDLKNRVLFAQNYDNPVFVSIHQNKFPMDKYSGLQVYYSKNHPDSKMLAENIQAKTLTYIQQGNNRKIKEAGRNIFLMHNLTCPAFLVECGFLSNSNEERLLNDFEYQKKLAFVMFSSIADYVNGEI